MNGEEIIPKEGISEIYLNYNLTFVPLERHIWKEKEKSGKSRVLSQLIQAIYTELNTEESWSLRSLWNTF